MIGKRDPGAAPYADVLCSALRDLAEGKAAGTILTYDEIVATVGFDPRARSGALWKARIRLAEVHGIFWLPCRGAHTGRGLYLATAAQAADYSGPKVVRRIANAARRGQRVGRGVKVAELAPPEQIRHGANQMKLAEIQRNTTAQAVRALEPVAAAELQGRRALQALKK